MVAARGKGWSKGSMTILRDVAVLVKYNCCCCECWAGMLIIVGIPDVRTRGDYSSAVELMYFLQILDRSRLVRLA